MTTSNTPEPAASSALTNPLGASAQQAAEAPARTLTPAHQVPPHSELVLKVMPMPGDSNANGDIFGGWVMAQVDIAGAVLSGRYTQGRMATIAVNEFIFKQPVRVGDVLSFYGQVVRRGRTSITVQIVVFAERIGAQGHFVKVTEATLTYVAIDENGKPRALPPETRAT